MVTLISVVNLCKYVWVNILTLPSLRVQRGATTCISGTCHEITYSLRSYLNKMILHILVGFFFFLSLFVVIHVKFLLSTVEIHVGEG